MSKRLLSQSMSGASKLSQQVGVKVARKLKAQRDAPAWSDLNVMGLIGWSIVVPTLLGAALGRWLDGHYPLTHSWTLMLIMMGLALGCWNAWRWVVKTGHQTKTIEEGNDE